MTYCVSEYVNEIQGYLGKVLIGEIPLKSIYILYILALPHIGCSGLDHALGRTAKMIPYISQGRRNQNTTKESNTKSQ